MEKQLREMINIGKGQYEFMPGKSTTDTIFALRQLMEKVSRRLCAPSMCFYQFGKGLIPRKEV